MCMNVTKTRDKKTLFNYNTLTVTLVLFWNKITKTKWIISVYGTDQVKPEIKTYCKYFYPLPILCTIDDHLFGKPRKETFSIRDFNKFLFSITVIQGHGHFYILKCNTLHFENMFISEHILQRHLLNCKL